ncbi:unnamed protein product [Prorocentrum cordatum]|uniref:Uncharacterized protein n=1 Tax=Prorocentrum cordatum TaxID=2364126 RepID=A0ABN9XT30_9DINO|nr:unnamed protein product [Polarella glacialis]
MKRPAEEQISKECPEGGACHEEPPGGPAAAAAVPAEGPSGSAADGSEARVPGEACAPCEASAAEVQTITTSADFWRCQIEAVYQRRNPHKLPGVPGLLDRHKGKEAILYAKVCKTYDLDPTKFYADPKAWESYENDVQDGEEAGRAPAEVPSLFAHGPPLFPPGGTPGAGLAEASAHADGDKKDGGAVAADCKTQ